MPGGGELDVFGGAWVEDVKEDALVFADADGNAIAEAFAVDGEALVADFPAVGFGVGLEAGRRGEFGLVLFFGRGEEGFPLVGGEEDFLIVAGGVFFGLDIDEGELAGVSAAGEVRHGHGVGVDEAGAGGDDLAAPVDELGGAGRVEEVDGDGDVFLEADEGAGDGAAVAEGGDGVVLGDVGEDGADADGEIGGSGGGGWRVAGRPGRRRRGRIRRR